MTFIYAIVSSFITQLQKMTCHCLLNSKFAVCETRTFATKIGDGNAITQSINNTEKCDAAVFYRRFVQANETMVHHFFWQISECYSNFSNKSMSIEQL